MRSVVRSILALAMAPLLAAAHPPAPVANPEAPVAMRAYVVEAKPLTSFGISLRMVAARPTKQVLRMFVREVVPDSEADYNRLGPGTEILSINGKAVDSFVVAFDPESDLGRLFVNRRRGDRIEMEVIDPGETTPRRVVLVAGRNRPPSPFLLDDWPF